MNRRGDTDETLSTQQSNRFFEENGYWYYRTREKVSFGPFDTKREAQLGVSDYIAFITHAKPNVVAMLEKMGQQSAAA